MFDSSNSGLTEIKFSLVKNAHSEGAMNIASGQMTILAYTWKFLFIILVTYQNYHLFFVVLVYLIFNALVYFISSLQFKYN